MQANYIYTSRSFQLIEGMLGRQLACLAWIQASKAIYQATIHLEHMCTILGMHEKLLSSSLGHSSGLTLPSL